MCRQNWSLAHPYVLISLLQIHLPYDIYALSFLANEKECLIHAIFQSSASKEYSPSS